MNQTKSPGLTAAIAFPLFLFIVLRLVPLLTGVERVSHYDEMETGAVVQDWLNGSKLLPWHYMMDPYGGEALGLAALALPCVKILGATLLAVKLPTFLFAILTFVLAFLFLFRFFGPSEARWGAVLMICAPASLVQLSLSGLSGHAESLAFNMAALYFFYDFISGSGKKKSLLLAGLFSGIAFWFYHETLIMTASFLLAWPFISRERFSVQSMLAFGGAFILGALPWILYNLYFGSGGFTAGLSLFFWMARTSFYYSNLLQESWQLLFKGLPLSFCFFPVFGVHEKIVSALYFLASFGPVMYFSIFKKQDAPKILPFLILPPLVLAAVLLTPYEINPAIGFIGYRYLLPLQFFMLILLAIIPAPVKQKTLCLAVAAAIGFASQTSLMFREPFGRAAGYSGSSWYHVGPQWYFTLPRAAKDPSAFSKTLEPRGAASNYFLLWGIFDTAAGNSSYYFLNNETAFTPAAVRASLPETSLPHFYEWSGSLQKDILGFKIALNDVPPSYQNFFFKGFLEHNKAILTECPDCVQILGTSNWTFRAYGAHLYRELESSPEGLSRKAILRMLERARALPFDANQKMLFFEGFGMARFGLIRDSNEPAGRSLKEIVRHLNVEEVAPFYRGLGWAIRSVHREDPKRAFDRLENLPEEFREEALKGFAEFEETYKVPA